MRKSFRVKKETEFQKVFETHDSVANRQFVVYSLDKPEQIHFRVGISVGKKIGNAVHRNWVKRRIRQAVFELKDQIRQDVDFIIIARPTTDMMSMKDIKTSLIHVLKLARLIKSDDDSEDQE